MDPFQQMVRQSPPVDLTRPCDDSWVKGRHVLITGGVGGFGAGFARRWAAAGASVVVGDLNSQKGEELVSTLREELGNPNIHFVRCNVTDWDSQVRFFKESLKLSPHGGIDTVVANAGIAKEDVLANPGDLGIDEPPRPDFSITDVNLYGVLYTVHLAMYYLPRNPGSSPSSPDRDPSITRDRHILLVGSMASLAPISMQPQYGAAKHGVLGLFRSLRTSTFVEGVRINMICPYFVETPIVVRPARLLLAGSGLGKVEDVVEAATRFTADSSICGRALCIGPPAKAMRSEDGQLLIPAVGDDANSASGPETGIWECYADDFEMVEAWTRRWVVLLKYIETVKGWVGWGKDVARALFGGWI